MKTMDELFNNMSDGIEKYLESLEEKDSKEFRLFLAALHEFGISSISYCLEHLKTKEEYNNLLNKTVKLIKKSSHYSTETA